MREKIKKKNRKKGDIGEGIACEYLLKRGFVICDRNYRKKYGEMDIVATKDNKIHFIEVKSVVFNNGYYQSGYKPEDNVHQQKIHYIKNMIQTYYEEKNLDREGDFAFDIICVYLNFVSRKAKIKMIENIIL